MVGTLFRNPNRHAYLRRDHTDPYQLTIVSRVIERVGLAPGDRILEVGAGTGRYTRLLRVLGLEVVATEPDPVLFSELEALGGEGILAVQAAVGAIPSAAWDVAGVCGFHVLHHLGRPELKVLGLEIGRLAAQPGFKGWFFVEPNPLNPLYPAQIAITPGMRFAEEIGIWRNDYVSAFAMSGFRCRVLGNIGVIPPQLSGWLPHALLSAFPPRLRKRARPTALYRVYGGLTSKNGDA